MTPRLLHSKPMKTLACLLLVALLTGCASVPKNMALLVKELAKDPATAYVRIPTPYGVLVFIRTNPGTNTVVHQIDADGGVRVGYKAASIVP